MKQLYLSFILLFFAMQNSKAQQTINGTLIDSISQNSIPFATITFNNYYGVIGNTQGEFYINIEDRITETDSLYISCLGYESKQLPVLNFKDSIINLRPKTFELNEVIISNKNYSIDEIIDKVKENLKDNYEFNFSKNKLFYRDSYHSNIIKSDVELKKSSIPEVTQKFIDSLLNAFPRKMDNYTEILGTKYGKINDFKLQKLDIIKASELYDKNNNFSFENYEEKINSIIRKHVKRDSYYKVKSGIIGTTEEIDSSVFKTKEVKEGLELIEQKKKQVTKKKENFLKYRRNSITSVERTSFIFEDTKLNFIFDSGKYRFHTMEYAYIENDIVYKISFDPKRSSDYKGVLYISPSDFAVVRLDFENVKPLKKFNLFGLSYNEYLHKGILVYSQNASNKYSLKYAEIESATRMGVKRPFSIIEKNKNTKGRRKQNELAVKVNFVVANTSKSELVCFESDQITEVSFNEFKEKAEVTPIYLPQYDPKFWKGYNVMEPNEAIKNFKSSK